MSTINPKWLVDLSPTVLNPQVKLICFPFAGGGTVNYSKWGNDLLPSIKLYGINLPGRERLFGQPFVTNYSQFIHDLATLLANDFNGPTLFFGHSFGALTAYFTALELKRLYDLAPEHLYVSARLPPSRGLVDPIATLNQEEFKTVLIERYQGIPQLILDNPEFLALFLPIIQNDFKLYEQFPQVLSTYPDPYIDCALTSISYKNDAYSELDIHNWKEVTHKAHQHLCLPGGHFSLLNDWKSIVDSINQWVRLHHAN